MKHCYLLFLLISTISLAAQPGDRSIGVARMDVTPAEPIRLTGYAMRQTNSLGVEQKLWAKALALGGGAEEPAVLITLDICGIAEDTYLELARRLGASARLPQERLVISCSHTHNGPCATGWAPNIFATGIPPEQQAVIDRYTRGLVDKLEKVALAALADRRPGKLSWAQGSVGFARNRRVVQDKSVQFGANASGPVDQALPILFATDEAGQVRAVVANYACHCTTLGGEFNRICGDWAGFAQEAVERDYPGAIALITIGCGADANPSPLGGPDGGLALARRHGEEIAAEVKRLRTEKFTPLRASLSAKLEHVDLPFGAPFTHTQWEERALKPGIVGYHARKYLERLDHGEKVPESLSYYAQTWSFGDELAMVFLSGEVVVDYALRLKNDFDPARLWVTAYANYVPCYIPSRRILNEGGYEAEDSLWYYDRPARISTNAEDLIIKTVHGLMPKSFRFDKEAAEFPPPKTVEQALGSFRTKANFIIDVAAAEPLIESPVAIDWGTDGRLWVCEMYDYPSGLDGQWKPGGRIKVLADTDGDGRYDKATLFLDGIPFPTGLMAWGKGVLVCAAPDILFAEDTDGDGKADVVKKLFSGFATHNFQARVNGLTWGLDGWVYGASGLFGGKVTSLLTGREVDLSGRDFRFKPDTGELEPVAGISQQGRIRDDWGNWFGNDNSTLFCHFPLPDDYVRRNPYVTYPDPRVDVTLVAPTPVSVGTSAARENLAALRADPNRLFPASRTLERFNDPQSANRTTSACGPEIYRDTLLGAAYYGNAFVCEPVHNLVHRLVLEPEGVTFAGRRDADEPRSEFLASTDNWFRPVQVRTGPDGALWVVDMYRFVIEHPRWIPPERLQKLDLRAGADKGRIYRLYPRGVELRPVRNLTRLPSTELVQALSSPNGPARDLAHMELTRRADAGKIVAERLHRIHAEEGKARGDTAPPAARAQMLWVAKAAGTLTPELLRTALLDSDARVRRQAVQLSEAFLSLAARNSALDRDLRNLAVDPDASVRYQLALSLGVSKEREAGDILAGLVLADPADRWLRAAVLSSATPHAATLFRRIHEATNDLSSRLSFAAQMIASAAGSPEQFTELFVAAAKAQSSREPVWDFTMLAGVFDALERRNQTPSSFAASGNEEVRAAAAAMAATCDRARQLAADQTTPDEVREAAISLLARNTENGRPGSPALEKEIEILGGFLNPGVNSRLQQAALRRLQQLRSPEVAAILLRGWAAHSPAQRNEILTVLLSRDDWVNTLLNAIEKGGVTAAEIPLSHRQRLLKRTDNALRQRAASLLATSTSSTRAEVLSKYQDVASLSGVPERGAAHFDKNCALCHAYHGHGQSVGPNLAEFAGKSVADFVVAILDPSAAVNPNFIAYNVETKDGRALTGIVKGETASSLALVQGGGVVEKILRSDIEELRASQLSLMPEGFEQSLAPQDLADLIAWLKQSAPPAFGSARAEAAGRARAEFLKEGANGLARVVSASERLDYPSWMGRLPLLHCRQTDGQSKVVWQTASVPSNLPAGSMREFRVAAAMGFLSQPGGRFQLWLNGKPVLDFDVSLGDQTWQSEDGKVRLSYSVKEANSEDSNGPLLIEVAAGLLERGKPATFEVLGSASQSQRWFGIYLLSGDSATAR